MPVISLPYQRVKNVKSIIISNTCDIDKTNLRNFPTRMVYAPIFSLEKYQGFLLKMSEKTPQQIADHISSIKRQRVTQVFYLPQIEGYIEDSLVFLDRLNNCPNEGISRERLKERRLFSLSDYGSYLFLFKLSIHFTRIQDNVDRGSAN